MPLCADPPKITVYNTASRGLEIFQPHEEKHVKMYVCGPTVYDSAHLGHARTYIAFDAIIRFLESVGYRVTYVRNITDVGHLRETGEDRMIHGATRERKHPMEVADKYMMEFFKDMDMLNIRRPNIQPRASMHIVEIIEMVQGLISRGYAYRVDGSVYFDIMKVDDYGKLSGIRREELDRHRIEPDPRKRNSADFALWKEAPPDYPLSWPSPWGRGFPGWHIECSVMSMKYLGEQIDIHGGGQELVFPHHENEIAQSESFTGKKPFVKYWLHTGELTVGGRGMHKSLGNFITIRQALQNYDADTIRLFMLSSHYRSPLDYSESSMRQALENIMRIRGLLDHVNSLLAETKDDVDIDAEEREFLSKVEATRLGFIRAMADDFNTPEALSQLYELVRHSNSFINKRSKISSQVLQSISKNILDLCNSIGLLLDYKPPKLAADAEKLLDILIEVRAELRRRSMYDLSDTIRSRLSEIGLIVEDTREGTRVRVAR
ncbi:MAG: cysteine--tRNA ligase [Aigarchaeota archaeon]|nr:cysteine--tRNA ligase [Candidatus Pelearchaeum maunauluense]